MTGGVEKPGVAPCYMITGMGSWSEPILHVDMDAFFVEVERLRNPDLRGRPVAVGGGSTRGVVASASYEARRFGVTSAMPTSKALRLCPRLVLVPTDHSEYERVSGEVFEVFRSFTPLVEGVSVDEAFLDVSGLRRHHPDPAAVGDAIRSRIRSDLGLPSSVGVAATKFVAKLASAAAKPDGQMVVPRESQQSFIRSLPLAALWGVGPATLAALARFGIRRVDELADTPPEALSKAVGAGLAGHLLALIAGDDPRPVETSSVARSISGEETFDIDLSDLTELDRVLRSQADRVAWRLRRSGVEARTVSVKIRFSDFKTITRSATLPAATSNDLALYRVATGLLRKGLAPGSRVRLLGLGCSNLVAATPGDVLDLDDTERIRRLDHTVDEIRDKFGQGTIIAASGKKG